MRRKKEGKKSVYEILGIYKSPSNLKYLWSFRSMSFICLIIQIITGIFLSMYYKSDIGLAFGSIEYISREVYYGWLVRYIHMNGASIFFLVVYISMLRSLLYSSYANPIQILWILGFIIFLCMILYKKNVFESYHQKENIILFRVFAMFLNWGQKKIKTNKQIKKEIKNYEAGKGSKKNCEDIMEFNNNVFVEEKIFEEEEVMEDFTKKLKHPLKMDVHEVDETSSVVVVKTRGTTTKTVKAKVKDTSTNEVVIKETNFVETEIEGICESEKSELIFAEKETIENMVENAYKSYKSGGIIDYKEINNSKPEYKEGEIFKQAGTNAEYTIPSFLEKCAINKKIYDEKIKDEVNLD